MGDEKECRGRGRQDDELMGAKNLAVIVVVACHGPVLLDTRTSQTTSKGGIQPEEGFTENGHGQGHG